MKHFAVGPKGGNLQFCDRETGEILRELHLPEGFYPLARFAPYRRFGEVMNLPGLVLALHGNSLTCKPLGQFESAANPSFRVSPADRQIKAMKRMMARTEALAKRASKALQATKRAKAAVPQIAAPAADGGAVVDNSAP